MERPELISPAGDKEKNKTAVGIGGDAVYLAGERFGMRTASKNFTPEQLQEGIRYAHERGVDVHVTLNILPHEEEFRGLARYMKELADMQADAFIISDPGVFQLARDTVPAMPLHISTQASVTNSATVNFWHAQGARRIVLARELSLEEILAIKENMHPDMELECFVHGAMCISYSGRCLLSGYMAGRDANRGDCAHACRWKYHLVEEQRPGEYFAIEEDEKGTYILNSKDLCLLSHIDKLMQAGIRSFKIEGRVKSAFYVATATRAYRRAIDAVLAGEFTQARKEELTEELKKCSHRKFTTGFLLGKPDEKDQNYASSGYERDYEFIGVVEEVNDAADTMTVSQRNKFGRGDNIEAMMPKGDIVSFVVNEMQNEAGEPVETAPHPKERVTIPRVSGIEKGAFLRRKGV